MWRANITGGTFYGGCLAVWHGAHSYTTAGRGEQCTSADAAGFPIAPLLFTADEVAAGHIDHAIRFILPNDRIAPRLRPAGHARHARPAAARTRRYYGVHLRLRARLPDQHAADRGRPRRRARDAEVRHVPRRRRQHRAHRAVGPPLGCTSGPACSARTTSPRSRSTTSRSSTTGRRSASPATASARRDRATIGVWRRRDRSCRYRLHRRRRRGVA